MLLLLAIVMLIGSYVAGNIPLVVNLSEVKIVFNLKWFNLQF